MVAARQLTKASLRQVSISPTCAAGVTRRFEERPGEHRISRQQYQKGPLLMQMYIRTVSFRAAIRPSLAQNVAIASDCCQQHSFKRKGRMKVNSNEIIKRQG